MVREGRFRLAGDETKFRVLVEPSNTVVPMSVEIDGSVEPGLQKLKDCPTFDDFPGIVFLPSSALLESFPIFPSDIW